MTDILAEMYGERAFQGQARLYITAAVPVDGVERIIIGGTVLTPALKGLKQWQRQRGRLIFMPTIIDETDEGDTYDIADMMSDEGRLHWKELWRAP